MYISNRAYFETDGSLGSRIELSEVERWKNLPPDILVKNVDRPLFAQLRIPFANTVDKTSLLPVSIYADSVDSINELDRIYSEFLWEVHTGKRRKIVDATAIKPKDGARTNPTEDMATDEYIVLNLIGTQFAGMKPFDDYTPEIRAEVYQAAINVQLRLIEIQCGFSAGTFTFDVRTGKLTATQIISEDNDTYNTIKAIQTSGMQQALLDLVYIYDVYATLYSLAPSGKIVPSVSFGDSIFEDTSVEFARRMQMVDKNMLKKEKFAAWYFEISEQEALDDYIPPAADDNIFGDDF